MKPPSDQWEIMPLFSTPLYLAQDIITPEILQQVKDLDYIDDIKQYNGACTESQTVLEDIPELRAIVEKHLNFFVHGELAVDIQHRLRHTCSWATRHLNGDSAHNHSHAHSVYSGVIYIQCNDNSGRLSLHNDTNHPTYISPVFMPKLNEMTVLNSSEWTIQPRNGLIALFPSTCVHSVESNKSHEHRYSVAFNYWLDGSYGDFTNLLTL